MKNLFWFPILSANKWLIIPFLLLCFKSSAQERTMRFIYSLDEKIPLAYLRILPDHGEQVFFTDIDGKIELPKTQIANGINFEISGYGINDTLISIQHVMSLDTIFLKAKEFELPEVMINSSKLSELKIGDSSAKEFEVSKPIQLHNGPNGVFYRYTIRVKVPKKKSLFLDEIKFYVSNILSEEVDVSLRILIPNASERLVSGKNNPIGEFKELLQSAKIMTITKSGWQHVNFSKPVQVPNRVSDLFIVFDLLEEEPKSKFAIVDQKTSKDIDLGFYKSGGFLGVFSSDIYHPAIEITFLK